MHPAASAEGLRRGQHPGKCSSVQLCAALCSPHRYQQTILTVIAQERRSHAGTSPARWIPVRPPAPGTASGSRRLGFYILLQCLLATVGTRVEGLLPRYSKKPAEARLSLSALLLCYCNILLWSSFPFFFLIFLIICCLSPGCLLAEECQGTGRG